MAQTKTKTKAKGPSSKGAAKGRSASKPKSRASAKGRSSSKSTASKPTASRKASNNGNGRMDTTLHTVEDKAKDAGRAVGGAAKKAKVPLVAGGAALAGAAGGLALGMRNTRRHSRIPMPRRPQLKVNSRDIAKAAKEVGNFSAQMGKLADELQENRESNGHKHRSPVEVVLDGLTSRR